MKGRNPSSYEYYEIGIRPGDFMQVLDVIEIGKKNAILYDRSDDKYFKPRYEVYVNGEKVEEAEDFITAETLINQYLGDR